MYTLDEADAAIELWEHYTGKTLDPEQRLSVQVMLAREKSGLWAAETTGRMVSRQNGKGDEVEVVEFYGITELGEAIIHSAHEIPTSRRAHERLANLIDSHRDLRNKRLKVLYGDGKQEIEMKGGGIIVYKTRTKAGGKGLDDISRLVMDEFQEAKAEHMAAMSSTLSVNPNPQVNGTGTAAVGAVSDLWWDQRERAIYADPKLGEFHRPPGRFGYLEHSAEVVKVDEDGMVQSIPPDPNDRENWKLANPAERTGRKSMRFMEEERNRLGDDLFCREHLGLWVPRKRTVSAKPKIDPHSWRLAYDKAEPKGKICIGVETGWELEVSAVVVCGRQFRSSTRQLAVVQHDVGSHWVELALLEVLDHEEVESIGFHSGGPSKALRPMLERITDRFNERQPKNRQVKLEPLGAAKYQAACAGFVADSTKSPPVLCHSGDPRLSNLAVSVPARLVSGGDGAWVWDTRVGDVTTLVAATCAATLAESLPEQEERSVYEEDDLDYSV